MPEQMVRSAKRIGKRTEPLRLAREPLKTIFTHCLSHGAALPLTFVRLGSAPKEAFPAHTLTLACLALSQLLGRRRQHAIMGSSQVTSEGISHCRANQAPSWATQQRPIARRL